LVNGATEAGPHTATARFQTERTDYRLTNETQEFIIEPKPLSEYAIEPIDNFFYKGFQIRPGITVKDGSKVLDEGIDYEVSYGENLTQSGTVSVTGMGNYSGTASRDFRISSEESAIVSVVWGTERTFAYDGAEHAPAATTSNLELEIIGKQTDAGSHTAVAQLKTPNPNIILANATMPYTITKKPLQVTWTAEREFVYNKMIQVPIPSVEEPDVELRVSNAYSEVGEYTAANLLAPYALIVSSNAGNYDLQNNSVDYAITKKPLEITISGGNNITLDTNYTDDIESILAYLHSLIAYSGFAKNTETGEEDNPSVLNGSLNISITELSELDTLGGFIRKKYSVSIDANSVSAKNYTPTGGDTYTIPVSSAALVPVTWSNMGPFVYDGKEQGPTATAENLVIEIIGKQTNAGSHTAVAQMKTPKDKVYLQNATMPYTIAPKELKVNWTEDSVFIYSKMPPPLRPSVTESGVDLRLDAYVNVGKYAGMFAAIVEIKDQAQRNNYILTNNTKNYEIIKKDLNPYFTDTLPDFSTNKADTLWVPYNVFNDSAALHNALIKLVDYNGFATDTVSKESDNATVLKGIPKVTLQYIQTSPFMLSKRRVETSQKAAATIVTTEVSADNYALTRPNIVIMATVEEDETADKVFWRVFTYR